MKSVSISLAILSRDLMVSRARKTWKPKREKIFDIFIFKKAETLWPQPFTTVRLDLNLNASSCRRFSNRIQRYLAPELLEGPMDVYNFANAFRQGKRF